ncbi:MAG: hypothetical protein ACW99G_17125 [Candidatus Thorarchaeota archaeon]|jgi:hypothetical protein
MEYDATKQEKKVKVALVFPDGGIETIDFDATTYTVVNGVLHLFKASVEIAAVQATRWLYAQVV